MILNNFKNQLKNYRKKKYQYITYNKKIISERNRIIFKILNSDRKKLQKNNKCCKNNFFKKNLNQNNLLRFYKKFNINLKLKKNYNLDNFKKLSNKDACLCSYIYFFRIFKKSKNINDIHKLNTVLKLNDLLILLYKPHKYSYYLKDLKKIMIYEKKLLKKFI